MSAAAAAAAGDAELRARLAEAERVAEVRARVVGHVAHEFRTPLSSILGFAALLADERDLSPERRREFVDVIQRNARHLLHVVNDILNLTKVEAGTLEVTLAAVQVGQVASAVVESLRPVAAELGVALSVVDAAGASACADAGRLSQVLLNLMDNAIKYSGKGRVVEVAIREEGDEVRVEVRDEGPGLTEEEQGLIFREFSRIHHPGARVAGAGLGLALAKELTEAMGGRIGVRSGAGAGSTFWVALPAVHARAVHAPEPPPPALAPHARREGTVAVVDDDADIRALATVVLEHAGYSVYSDDGSAGAAERLAAARPVAVLLDLNLNDRTGAEVLREIRGVDSLRAVPVLAFTAAVSEADRRGTREAGFDGHLAKPVEPDHLLARVDEVMAEGRRRALPAPVEPPDEDFWGPLRARFRAGLPARIAELEASVAALDADAAARQLHKLRGTSAGYGFTALADRATVAEEALRAGEPVSGSRKVAEVVRLMREEADRR